MPLTATLTAALQPLRADPARSAILLDVDGTLAPIVQRPQDARVPEETRATLAEVARTYGVVACVSGRQARAARTIVGLDAIAYIGAHGAEHLPPSGTDVRLDPEVAAWTPQIHAFVRAHTAAFADAAITVEDKDAIVALHWRGVADEDAAHAALLAIAAAAADAGLATHWGRKVLELRPPVPIDKGRGIIALLRDAGIDQALYAGDDRTDIDAFASLRVLADGGLLTHTVCVGVRSDETPIDLTDAADLMVDGTDGVVDLLKALR